MLSTHDKSLKLHESEHYIVVHNKSMLSCRIDSQKENNIFNTSTMKQPDLYYFETIKMTSHA